MKLFKEFREFAVKGNVIDLAVGVIIGGAFGKIVTSLVDDVIMPIVGTLTSNVDYADLKIILRPEHKKLDLQGNPVLKDGKEVMDKALTLNYGNFINVVVQFLILAFVIFLMVKAINKARTRFEPPATEGEPVTKQCPYCLSDVPTKASKCKFCTADLLATA